MLKPTGRRTSGTSCPFLAKPCPSSHDDYYILVDMAIPFIEEGA